MRKRVLSVAAGDATTLLAWLGERLQLDAQQAAAIIKRGAVAIDGRRTTSDFGLRVGQRITTFIEDNNSLAWSIAFADDWLLVVEKPSGMAAQPTRSDEAGSLEASVRQRHPDARMLHRL